MPQQWALEYNFLLQGARLTSSLLYSFLASGLPAKKIFLRARKQQHILLVRLALSSGNNQSGECFLMKLQMNFTSLKIIENASLIVKY